jgi:hypothetical protein
MGEITVATFGTTRPKVSLMLGGEMGKQHLLAQSPANPLPTLVLVM